jgi:thiol-disulfide isomerase/thioredoxin
MHIIKTTWPIIFAVLGLQLLLPAPVHASGLITEDPVDITLEKLGGGEVSLSDYRGQWVVLNYWATWCAPCRKEMPELSDLHTERDGLIVFGLAYEDTDDSAFDAFLEEFDVRFPVLRVDVYNPPEPFGAPRVLPTTYILDTTGRAVKSFVGPVTREAIEEFIDASE